MNTVSIVGRLTRDPELRKTQSGTSVLSFTTAVNRRFKKEGEPDADFINCVAWNQSADFLSKYATKGALLSVAGRINTRNYEDKTGNRVYVTEVVAEQVQLLESRAEAEKRESSDNQGYQEVAEDFGGPTLDISSDDLPF